VFEGFKEGKEYVVVMTMEGGLFSNSKEFVYDGQDKVKIEHNGTYVRYWGF
jgi:hypothetical protein